MLTVITLDQRLKTHVNYLRACWPLWFTSDTVDLPHKILSSDTESTFRTVRTSLINTIAEELK